MKRTFLVFTLILLSVAVTKFQIDRINRETLQTYETVYVYAEPLLAGTVITTENIKEGKINTQYMSDDYFKGSKGIIGKTLANNVSKNSVITPSDLKETLVEQAGIISGNAEISLKLSPESAVCWQLNPKDYVALYWVDEETNSAMYIGAVLIKKVLNEQLENDTVDNTTRYTIIEAPLNVVETVIAFRDSGRFELVIKDASAYKSDFEN